MYYQKGKVMKQKLLELLHNIPEEILGTAELADYLMNNGVTVCTHCEKCIHYTQSKIRDYYGWCLLWGAAVRNNGYCHNAERTKYEKD